MNKPPLDIETIFQSFAKLASEYFHENQAPETKVTRYLKPTELKEKISLNLAAQGESLTELFSHINTYLNYSVRTGHPQFFNQLFSGQNAIGILGEMVTALTNTSMYTYEVAPVATLLEQTLIKKMASLCGFSEGEGIFVTGGSNANLVALLAARNRAFPSDLKEGLPPSKTPVFFISEEAHYSFSKAAIISGIGLNQLIKIPVNAQGQMDLSYLKKAIENTKVNETHPFMVVATAGTTVRGAFDPIPAIAAICHEHKLWLHVDAAWGGSALLSRKHRHLLTGLEKADSVTWDTHKLMGLPLISSVFLLKEQGTLKRINNITGSDYLFHSDENENMDLGEISFQCGRRVDALKLWLVWKYFGDEGFEERIDHLFNIKDKTMALIKAHPKLRICGEAPYLNICFTYEEEGVTTQIEKDAFQIELRTQLYQQGLSFVNYAKVDGKVVIRLILANFELTESDVLKFIDNLEQVADQILKKSQAN